MKNMTLKNNSGTTSDCFQNIETVTKVILAYSLTSQYNDLFKLNFKIFILLIITYRFGQYYLFVFYKNIFPVVNYPHRILPDALRHPETHQ